jgi:hypothetical protein
MNDFRLALIIVHANETPFLFVESRSSRIDLDAQDRFST